jgi:glycosyltransferase involved in cell wall biosynthesis
MQPTNPRLKVALLVNMIVPARIPLYSGLAEHFDLLVLHGGTEANRTTWHDMDKWLPAAKVIKAWGWQIRLGRKVEGREFDKRYLHITPGYLWHLLRFQPDVVVSNEMGLRTLIALFYGTLFGKPVWVWWGGTSHTESGIGFVKRHLRKFISRWAKHWISYGQSSTQYLVSLGIGAERILEIQNSVDERRFAGESEPLFHLQLRPVLLHVGQFIARKGIESLLQAAATVQKEGLDFSLLFVGSGPNKSGLEQLARELQLKNVHFEGPQRPAVMPSVYRSADALIFPTLEDVWGLVANEAMLSGLPVLCSKYAGCAKELFGSRSIFDPKNPEEFAQKLKETVQGQLPRPDASRLRSTPQLVSSLVQALEECTRKPFEPAPASTGRLSAGD